MDASLKEEELEKDFVHFSLCGNSSFRHRIVGDLECSKDMAQADIAKPAERKFSSQGTILTQTSV